MKIPLDFFLRLIEKFLSEQEFDKVIKKLKKHFETPEEDFSDILSDLSLQDIISKYVKENKELKKKLKAKSKKFLEESKANEEDEEKEEKKITNKKRKRTMSSTKEEEKEEEKKDKKNKKRKRTMSSTKDDKDNEEEKEEKKSKRKRTMSSAKDEKEEKSAKKRKKTEDKDDGDDDEKEDEKEIKKNKKKKKKDDDEDIDLEKEVQFVPKPKSDNNPNRVPFKRIDDTHIKYQVPEKLRDNSYAAFMKQTGDDFGKAANDKLIVTRGKGFRKEKTKFKNKTFHGGNTISTTVRSIPLEDDSSSDEQ